GAAIAARLDRSRRIIKSAGSVPQWEGCDVFAALTAYLPAGTVLVTHNDAAAQALAEAPARMRRDPKLIGVPFIFVALGTGIGTAIVLWNGDVPVAYACEYQHNPLVVQAGL